MRTAFLRMLPLIAALGLLLCGAAFAEDDSAALPVTQTLKVGYVDDRVPISFQTKDGELGGVSRRIFDRIAELTGLSFEYEVLPGGAVTYDYLKGEGFDLVTSVEYNRENQKARGILISNPYLESRKVVVAHEGLAFDSHANSKLALSSGSQTIKLVLAKTFPNFEVVDYPSTQACFDAVRKGEADLTIVNQYLAEYWLHRPIYENMQVLPVMGLDDLLCFSAVIPLESTPEETARAQSIIDAIDGAIERITDDEVMNFIIEETLANQYEYTMADTIYRFRHTLVVMALSVLLIAALVALVMRLYVRSLAARADEKARRRFLSTMSHEIRTPLNGLIGLSELMIRSTDDPPRMKSYLQQLEFTAKYLLSLISDMLDMSQLQSRALDLAREPVDLKLLLSTVEHIETPAMKKKSIDFTIDAELPLPGVWGDPVRIEQVLLNVLDNACKFTQEGGSVNLRIRQSENKDGKIVTRAEVQDNGCGIGEAFQKRIFDLFEQESHEVSKGNQGTGLGLPISHRLAKLMDGDLSVSSKKGEGSKFTFTFAADPAPLPQREEAHAEPSAAPKPRILIAEDNELNAQILVELLAEEGFESAVAANGREAVELFSASKPGEYGVILMDLLMPEMNGFDAALAIRALEREDAAAVRILACTANAFEEDAQRAKECGMNGFISKPIDMARLMRALDEA